MKDEERKWQEHKADILDFFKLDLTVLGEIINEFTDNGYIVRMFAVIDEALEQKQYHEVMKTVHKMKGSLSYFHINSITNTLIEIEKYCKENPEPERIRALLSSVQTEYNRLEKILSEIKASI